MLHEAQTKGGVPVIAKALQTGRESALTASFLQRLVGLAHFVDFVILDMLLYDVEGLGEGWSKSNHSERRTTEALLLGFFGRYDFTMIHTMYSWSLRHI